MWNNFRPAIRFVVIFVLTYFVGNLLYGFYVTSLGSSPDFFTREVAHHSVGILNFFGGDVTASPHPSQPSIPMMNRDQVVINIFEGCNGVNVVIVFVAFILSFGGSGKKMLWFIPVGIFLIHLVNLGRILLLYWVAIDYQRYFYYVHKFFFTAILYVFVFVLWVAWVKLREREPAAA
jgi:exosortase family protein XrtF